MARKEQDQLIGRNVTALRGERTQQWLADAMRKRTHRWSQATVWSVEKGERPLKLVEARDLAQVLNIGVAMLWQEEWNVARLRRLTEAQNLLPSATAKLFVGITAVDSAREQLADALAQIVEHADVRPDRSAELGSLPWRVARAQEDLQTKTVEALVRSARGDNGEHQEEA